MKSYCYFERKRKIYELKGQVEGAFLLEFFWDSAVHIDLLSGALPAVGLEFSFLGSAYLISSCLSAIWLSKFCGWHFSPSSCLFVLIITIIT